MLTTQSTWKELSFKRWKRYFMQNSSILLLTRNKKLLKSKENIQKCISNLIAMLAIRTYK